jgi:hypothetical protein
MLEKLLLEIRNLEGDELKYAPKLAYIFHNVPALLQTNFNKTNGDETFAVIQSRAQALGLSSWVDSAEKTVLQRLDINDTKNPG